MTTLSTTLLKSKEVGKRFGSLEEAPMVRGCLLRPPQGSAQAPAGRVLLA